MSVGISLSVCAFVWAEKQARLSDRVNQVAVFVFVFPRNVCFCTFPFPSSPRAMRLSPHVLSATLLAH